MTAPSIKETLKLAIKFIESHMHYSQPGPDRGEEPSDMFTHEALPVVVGLNAALATLQPSGERQEAIPEGRYRLVNYLERLPSEKLLISGEMVDVVRPQYLLASDRDDIARILASGLVQNEAAIRADEREKCAKEIDARAEEIALKQREQNPLGTSYLREAKNYREASVAIRSARDGGAS